MSENNTQPELSLLAERMMILAIWIGCFLGVLNITNINIALPTLIQAFHTDMASIQWVVVIYMLANGLAMPMVGYFVDRFSGKIMYVFGMTLMAISSLICALAGSLPVMIGARLIQGLAGGILMPVSSALVYQFIPRERQLMIVSVNSMISVLGVAVGPSLAGVIVNFFSWQGIFLANIPLCIAVVLLSWIFIPKKCAVSVKKLDVVGLSCASIGTVGLLLGFNQGGKFGWTSPMTLVLLGLGMAAMVFFVIYETRLTKGPMLNFAVFAYKGYTVAVLVYAVMNIGTNLAPIYMAIFLQDVLLLSPLQAGLALIIPSLVMAVMAPVSAKAAVRFGYRETSFVGMLVLIVGSWLLSRFTLSTTLVWFTFCLCVRYVGIGLLTTIVNNYGMASLPKRLVSHGAAMFNWIRQLIATISVSVFGIIYSNQTLAYTVQNTAAGLADAARLGELVAINNMNLYTVYAYIACLLVVLLMKASYMTQGMEEEAMAANGENH